MRQISLFIFVLTLALLAIGCSGVNQNPAMPGVLGDSQPDGVSPDSGDGVDPGLTDENRQGVDVTSEENSDDPLDMTDDDHPFDGMPLQGPHMLWGLWQIMIDKEDNSIEIIPMRASNMHLNALSFLEPGGEYAMLQVVGGLNWNGDKTILDVDVQITHPFPTFPQFSGFDVKGILISRADFGGFSDPDLLTSGPDHLRILNSDGYTRWWNPEEFPGNNIFSYVDGALGMKDEKFDFQPNLNGFKYFSDELGPTDPVEGQDIAMRGVFSAGAVNTRHYTIAVPNFPTSLIFNYAVDASWEPPLVKPPDIPGDFPPEANQTEPWAITATEVINTLYYDEILSEQGGELILEVAVYDWQNPAEAPAGTITRVVAEWPGLFDMSEAGYISNEGDYSLWEIILTPHTGVLASTDDVEYMIWAESTDGGGYGGRLDPSVPLISAARFMTSVASEEPNVGPQIQGSIVGNTSPGLVIEQYSLSASDPNGDPLTYTWNIAPHIVDDPGNGDGTIDIDWSVFGLGDFTVECSVTDSINPPVDAPPLPITVGNVLPTVGPIVGPTEVDASFTDANYSVIATDPDFGQTLSYAWSFVADGDPEDFSIPGDVIDGSLTIDFSTVAPGDYDINVQVSDGVADVNGIAIDVAHGNTIPNVGQVDGKTPVTVLDTDELYSAPWSDPDTTQTLSFLWSIVPEGDTENFVDPSNPDGSINIDWSALPVASYDLNVQADDGMAVASGTKLTIIKENTPPSLGDIEGPTDVTSADTAAHYTVTVTDPDILQPVTVLWSIVPTGDAPVFDIPANPDDSVDIDWSLYADDVYDVNVQADDGFDQVEGTPLVVTKADNTPPVIDVIVGSPLVTCTRTDELYMALITDPDSPPQVLTVMWSVVPTGDLAIYDIPANPDYSVNIDWSTYEVGQYDINVQVDDGFVVVEGDPLVVDRLNTPPAVGTIIGEPNVLPDAFETYYVDPTSTDCDIGQTISFAFSVVPKGDPADYSIITVGDTIDINWPDYGLGEWTIGCQVFDGIEYAYADPLDVLVALCIGTSAHNFTGSIYLNEYSIAAMSVLPRADVAFIDEDVAFFGGNGVVQIGSHSLGLFNADTTGALSVSNTLNFGTPDTVTSIDAGPIEGRLLTVTASSPHIINILDPDTLLGTNPVDGYIDSGNPAITWIAIDIEADGDFWAVQRDATVGLSYVLVRYTYVDGSPFYTFDPSGTLVLDSWLSGDPKIFDIAVNMEDNMMYLLENGPIDQGRMLTFMVLDGSAAAFMGIIGDVLFTDTLDFYDSSVTGVNRFADIEIDHKDAGDEKCRIVLYGRLIDGRGEVIRMDSYYNVLDREYYTEGHTAFAINTDADPGTRNLILPTTDSIEFWQTPVDW